MAKLIFTKDINGFNSYGLPECDNIYNATLTSGGGETNVTVPSNWPVWAALFSIEPGSSVYIAVGEGATAALPAGATLASASSELNPTIKQVKAGDKISLITGDATANVSVSLYEVEMA
jgi:aconitase B